MGIATVGQGKRGSGDGREGKGVRGWRDNRTHNRTSYKDNQKWKGERERKTRNLKKRDGKGIPKEWEGGGGQKRRKEK